MNAWPIVAIGALWLGWLWLCADMAWAAYEQWRDRNLPAPSLIDFSEDLWLSDNHIDPNSLRNRR